MSLDLSTIDTSLASIQASPELLALLKDLHTQALTEPSYLSTDAQPATAALDKFVALEPDKCALVYLLMRASGAKHVVEAGTSFGVSTIYLSLAVGQNIAASTAAGPDKGQRTTQHQGQVIATENEPTKATRARQHWRSAGTEIEKYIDLREGDLRETLKHDLPDAIDFVLLDIWAHLALPTLKLVLSKLRVGATIVADNVTAAAPGYKDLYDFMNDPVNGFRSTVAPYAGGLGVSIYIGRT